MCDPITLIGGAMGLFGMFASMSETQPEPPPVETPAIAAPTGREPGATVRLGNSSDDITNNQNPNNSTPSLFTERRTSGNPLGNLGKSGLTI